MTIQLLAWLLCALALVAVHQGSDLADGVTALNAGDADRAIALLERAAAAAPQSRLALLHLANAHLTAWLESDGDAEDLETHGEAAVAALHRAVRNDPRDALARWNVAMAYGRLERLGDSVAELRQLLAIAPSYPNGARALGTLLALIAADAKPDARPGLDEALQRLEQARALDPTSADAVAMTAFALRVRAETAPDRTAADRDRLQAAAFTKQATALRRQVTPPASGPLDPDEPPPPFSPPGAPPPPPGPPRDLWHHFSGAGRPALLIQQSPQPRVGIQHARVADVCVAAARVGQHIHARAADRGWLETKQERAARDTVHRRRCRKRAPDADAHRRDDLGMPSNYLA